MSIAAKCPAAVRNPDTQKPVDKKQVYTVLKTACYDRVPEEPWVCERCRNRGWSSRTAAEASTLPSGTSPSCGLARSGKARSRL